MDKKLKSLRMMTIVVALAGAASALVAGSASASAGEQRCASHTHQQHHCLFLIDGLMAPLAAGGSAPAERGGGAKPAAESLSFGKMTLKTGGIEDPPLPPYDPSQAGPAASSTVANGTAAPNSRGQKGGDASGTQGHGAGGNNH